MIPTAILFGFIFGRWWRAALIIATIGWPVLLVATDVMDIERGLAGAAALAAANALVGIAFHQLILRTVRQIRRRSASPAR